MMESFPASVTILLFVIVEWRFKNETNEAVGRIHRGQSTEDPPCYLCWPQIWNRIWQGSVLTA